MSEKINQKNVCLYCGRHLMPVKTLEWSNRKYHKKCNKEVKIIEAVKRREQQLYIEDYNHYELLLKLNTKF